MQIRKYCRKCGKYHTLFGFPHCHKKTNKNKEEIIEIPDEVLNHD